VNQGLAIGHMPARRELYRRARFAVTDCIAILDMLVERGTVEPEVLGPARSVAQALASKLVELTQPAPKTY
jgi:hypothetical protein